MNATAIMYTKSAFLGLLIIVSGNSVLLAKCGACQQAAAIRQSIKDAAIAAAALATGKPSTVNKPSSREMELDSLDLIASDICVCCAQQDKTSVDVSGLRCAVCQEELIKNSIAEAAAAELDVVTTVNDQIELGLSAVAKTRAVREGLNDGEGAYQDSIDEISACHLENNLRDIMNCCVCTNGKVDEQNSKSKKYYKRLQFNMTDIKSQINKSAQCCSVVETRIGDLEGSAIDIPACEQRFNIVDIINNTDADVITWLKSLYILLYRVYLCSCLPCGEVEN